MLARILERVVREERGRVLARLVREVDRFELAEDAVQDATTKALEVWTRDGLPKSPAAWLLTTARRRAIDLLRRSRSRAEFPLVDDVAQDEAEDSREGAEPEIEDDRLRLLFTCCHPALGRSAQVALALRTLCGLTTAEIAAAHLEAEATTAQRIVRAKRKIDEARIPFEVPGPRAFPDRLGAVLEVVYFVFNEGYSATSGSSVARPRLADEAIRLGRTLVVLLPSEVEPRALLALMLLHDARRSTRMDASGALVPLEEQDRSRWDRAQITEGLAMLDGALALAPRGAYLVQAAIAALHASAETAAATDWRQISLLYRSLLFEQPSDVVLLNAAVALAMASTPARGLAVLDQLEQRGTLAEYRHYHTTRGELLRRAQRGAEARRAFERALALTSNDAERKYLQRRLSEVANDDP